MAGSDGPDLSRTLRTFAAKGVTATLAGGAVVDFENCSGMVVAEEQGLPSGFFVIRSALSRETQLRLAQRSIYDWAFNSGWNNLAANQRDEKFTLDHLSKLTWSTLGWHYDWTNRRYVDGWRGEFPSDLASICVDLAEKVGVQRGTYTPTAAIVNYYSCTRGKGPMGAHRDDAELTMAKPIVSLSIGASCVFCIETKPFDPSSEVLAVHLRSGDVAIMSGASRPALHAVAWIFPHSSPFSKDSSDFVERYLADHRINLNTRQVEGDALEETWAGKRVKDP